VKIGFGKVDIIPARRTRRKEASEQARQADTQEASFDTRAVISAITSLARRNSVSKRYSFEPGFAVSLAKTFDA